MRSCVKTARHIVRHEEMGRAALASCRLLLCRLPSLLLLLHAPHFGSRQQVRLPDGLRHPVSAAALHDGQRRGEAEPVPHRHIDRPRECRLAAPTAAGAAQRSAQHLSVGAGRQLQPQGWGPSQRGRYKRPPAAVARWLLRLPLPRCCHCRCRSRPHLPLWRQALEAQQPLGDAHRGCARQDAQVGGGAAAAGMQDAKAVDLWTCEGGGGGQRGVCLARGLESSIRPPLKRQLTRSSWGRTPAAAARRSSSR